MDQDNRNTKENQLAQEIGEDIKALRGGKFTDHSFVVTDANVVLAKGVYPVSNTAANVLFGGGTLIITADQFQKVQIHYGASLENQGRLAVRRWDSGVPTPWKEMALQEWVDSSVIHKTGNETKVGDLTVIGNIFRHIPDIGISPEFPIITSSLSVSSGKFGMYLDVESANAPLSLGLRFKTYKANTGTIDGFTIRNNGVIEAGAGGNSTQWNEAYGWKGLIDSKGTQLTADQPNAMVHLKDANGNTISSLNVGFLNNEGTTINFNSANDTIELKDDQGNVLSSFPASALVSNMPDNLNLNGTSLELRDVSNTVLSSVTLTMGNIQGLTAELAGKEPAFSKNSAFNKDFGTGPGTVLEGNTWGSFISYVDNAVVKDIRVDGSASVTITPSDDVVIMTDNTVAIGTITIPSAASSPEKEYWLVQHWNYAALSENYIASDGSTTNLVAEALHLKSDGVKWYQTNNRGTPNYVKISSPGPVLVGTITKYTGENVGMLTLPEPGTSKSKSLKIIAERPATLSQTYIDTDGSQVNRTEEPLAAGTVIELISDGTNWEKIN